MRVLKERWFSFLLLLPWDTILLHTIIKVALIMQEEEKIKINGQSTDAERGFVERQRET